MHDAVGMDDDERLGEVVRHPGDVGPGRRAEGEPCGERRPVDELHHQVGDVAAVERRAARVEERDERAMAQRGEQVDLRPDALQLVRIRRGGYEHLERHLAAQHLVGGAMHERHPAGAEQRAEPIPSDEHAPGLERIHCLHGASTVDAIVPAEGWDVPR